MSRPRRPKPIRIEKEKPAYQPRTPEEEAALPPWLLESEKRQSAALTELLSEREELNE